MEEGPDPSTGPLSKRWLLAGFSEEVLPAATPKVVAGAARARVGMSPTIKKVVTSTARGASRCCRHP